MATIDPDMPLYDSKVRYALGLGNVGNTDYKKRVEEAESIYNHISDFYNDDEYKIFREECVTIFNSVFPQFADETAVSHVKKIDFVLWGIGKRNERLKDYIG